MLARAALVLLLALLCACAVNPVSRRPELVLVSASEEQKLGDAEAKKIAQELGMVTEAKTVTYVQAVGARLAARSPRQDVDYTFHLVDSDIVNAFALPGGYVYITRGLLVRTNSEDELATVMGHEIGHIAGRHAAQRVTRAAPLAVVTGIPAAAVGLLLPGLGRTIGSIGTVANSLVLAPYSRGQETQSDEVGQTLAAALGWDPHGLPQFMRTLERQEKLDEAKPPPAFARTHPLTSDRVREGQAFAETLEVAQSDPVARDRDDFLSRLEGLRVGDNPAEGIFEDDEFLQADLDFWLRFPPGWETFNAKEFVGARSPEQNATIVLQIAGRGSDPLTVARNFAHGAGAAFGLLPKKARLGSYDAARAVGRAGGATVDISWIAYGGLVYQITGACGNGDYDGFQTPFIDVPLSMRPLSTAERERVVEWRLRIVEAQEGESLGALVERLGGRWSAEQTAVANALDPEAPLLAGQRLKLPLAQPYRAAASEESAEGAAEGVSDGASDAAR